MGASQTVCLYGDNVAFCRVAVDRRTFSTAEFYTALQKPESVPRFYLLLRTSVWKNLQLISPSLMLFQRNCKKLKLHQNELLASQTGGDVSDFGMLSCDVDLNQIAKTL